MMTYQKKRLWTIEAEKDYAFDKYLLNDVFDSAYTLITPSKVEIKLLANDLNAYELHSLLEQDTMVKIRLTRGPLCHTQSALNHSKVIIDLISRLSKTLYPQKLICTFESVASHFDKQILNVFLNHICNDKEMHHTIIAFCDNNLNATATAEKLYLHRNTLLYRLEKIEHATGFNLKFFTEAANLYYGLKKIETP